MDNKEYKVIQSGESLSGEWVTIIEFSFYEGHNKGRGRATGIGKTEDTALAKAKEKMDSMLKHNHIFTLSRVSREKKCSCGIIIKEY